MEKAFYPAKPNELTYMQLPTGEADVWLRANIEAVTEVDEHGERIGWQCDETYLRTTLTKSQVEEQFMLLFLEYEKMKKYFSDAVQEWMDKKVQERNYDDVHTCVGTYLYSPVEKFRLEAELVKDWVSYVWAKCYEILDEVVAGRRNIPTLEELFEELPPLEWDEI